MKEKENNNTWTISNKWTKENLVWNPVLKTYEYEADFRKEWFANQTGTIISPQREQE